MLRISSVKLINLSEEISNTNKTRSHSYVVWYLNQAKGKFAIIVTFPHETVIYSVFHTLKTKISSLIIGTSTT